jgi:hypothetical protein
MAYDAGVARRLRGVFAGQAGTVENKIIATAQQLCEWLAPCLAFTASLSKN